MLESCLISGFADEIGASVDTQLKLLNKLNVGYLEFRSGDGKGVAEYSLDEAATLKGRLDASGVRVSAIGSPIGKIGINDDFAAHFETFKHVVEIASVMNTKLIRMFSFYMPKGEPADQFRGKVLQQLNELIDYAKKFDIVLLHENEKGIYGDDAAHCLELFESLGCDNFKGIFDFANFVQCKQDTLEAYKLLAPYITYIHVKDALWADGKVVPAGEGDGHLKEIFSDLDARGYNGFLSLEPHLASFDYFKQIERDANELDVTNNEYVWQLAYNSLVNLLGNN